jgi:predicted ATP-grasp superfamily ATP-dependent carboligase
VIRDNIRLRDGHTAALPASERQGDNASSESPRATDGTSAVHQQPAVFVMNPYYTGLGIARCLHGHGLKVVGLTSEHDAPGVRSRYFHSILDVPNGRDEPEALCRRLVELGRTLDHRPLLVPTRDFDVLFIHDYFEALSPYYILTQPRRSDIMAMMDKYQLAQVADRIGIASPNTIVCHSAEELQEKAVQLRFPVIMKPRFAYQWRKQGVWTRVGAQKAIIADSAEFLLQQYRQVSGALSEALVQEFVPGEDCDIVVCCGYMDERGELLGHFTGRKLRQDPPLVGTGCAVEADEIIAIVEPTKRLLRAFRYSGMAEVEYKYDRSSGIYYLIEINPRHWDQHELGRLVGVNLSLIAYRHLTGHTQTPQNPVYRAGVRYRWVAERELAVNVLRRIRLELSKPGRSSLGKLQGAGEAIRDGLRLLTGHKVFSVWRFRFRKALMRKRFGNVIRSILKSRWSNFQTVIILMT